jgi:glycosyltransferase involved in cell wall biosynthesis
LNNASFLPERLTTIVEQSFEDWELVVVDSYSSDGAWEYLMDQAKLEPRMRIYQAPREGIYAGLNKSLKLARAQYVYIATSDDTMAPDCLAKLVNALERHPECDLAHCPLRIIDEEGREMPNAWSKGSLFARSSGSAIEHEHVRMAPLDGLLHLTGESVYISLTQLLIRKSLFDRVGLFDGRWESLGDFNWNMRASLIANTVHVPHTWAGWRVHSAQATQAAQLGTAAHRNKIDDMIHHAIESTAPMLDESVAMSLRRYWWNWLRKRHRFTTEIAHRQNRSERLKYVAGRAILGDSVAWNYVWWRVTGFGKWGRDDIQTIRLWGRSLGLPEL